MMLATGFFGGLTIAYRQWDPWISIVGLIIVAVTVIAFGVTHIRWPYWFTDLRRIRVRFYKSPYDPDVFLSEAQSQFAGSIAVVKKTVQLKPYGWDERDPMVRITYHIFNGSQFKIQFDNPRGNLWVGKSKLRDLPMINSGKGSWNSLSTAKLEIDQGMTLEFWNELAKTAESGSVLKELTGDFHISVSTNIPGVEAQGVSLNSETPFLVTSDA